MVFLGSAVDLFVVRGLSIGVALGYEHFDQQGNPTLDLLSAGPRIGYNVPLGDRWSFWPDVYATYQGDWSGGMYSSGLAGGAYAPVLYHPAAHLFLGLGPKVSTAWIARSVTTEYGLALSVGGWLGP
jgi:hypothetical protein